MVGGGENTICQDNIKKKEDKMKLRITGREEREIDCFVEICNDRQFMSYTSTENRCEG